MQELQNRAADVERERLSEALVNQRARGLKEAWSMLPRQ